MKHLLILALIPLTVMAQPDPRVDRMAKHCQSVMEQGASRLIHDKKVYKTKTVKIDEFVVDTESYNRFRLLGDRQAPGGGGFMVCNQIYEACSAGWDAADCKVARASWRY